MSAPTTWTWFRHCKRTRGERHDLDRDVLLYALRDAEPHEGSRDTLPLAERQLHLPMGDSYICPM